MQDLAVTPPLFKETVFDDPSVRDLSRVGVIDIGSNSVRLVVFDGAARSPAYFFNEKIMCGLGVGLSLHGRLNPEGRTRAIAAIARFKQLALSMGIQELTAVATAAVRTASDGQDFCQEVMEKTGQFIAVISGEEEAKLSAQGVLTGWPGAYGLVCDLGGISLELAEISNGKVGTCTSSELGPLKLMDIDKKKERLEYINSQLSHVAKSFFPQNNRLFLVGGSWRALARIDMERSDHPLRVLHEYRMEKKSIKELKYFIKDHGLENIAKQCSISANRIMFIPYAIEILEKLSSVFKSKDIAISSYGIREGMLYEKMPQMLKDRDPLIEACRFAEAKDSRVPGAGKALFNFVKPLFLNVKESQTRLILAACYLHDVSWRAHPDYRHEACFDYITRANLGGLKHSERVFLGLALLFRYKNSHSRTSFDPLLRLLSSQKITDAEILGKAMRLGANLWVTSTNSEAYLKYIKKKNKLSLKVGELEKKRLGEISRLRLDSLAQSLKAEVEISDV